MLLLWPPSQVDRFLLELVLRDKIKESGRMTGGKTSLPSFVWTQVVRSGYDCWRCSLRATRTATDFSIVRFENIAPKVKTLPGLDESKKS